MTDHGMVSEPAVTVRHPSPGMPVPAIARRHKRPVGTPRESGELRHLLIETTLLVLVEPNQDLRASVLALLETRMKSYF